MTRLRRNVGKMSTMYNDPVFDSGRVEPKMNEMILNEKIALLESDFLFRKLTEDEYAALASAKTVRELDYRANRIIAARFDEFED